MPYDYGPPRIDFSPLSRLVDDFLDSRNKAMDYRLKRAQLEAPSAIANYQAQGLNDGAGLIPTSPDTSGQTGAVPLSNLGQGYNAQGKAPTFTGQPTQAASLLQKFEGFSNKPYWDVNAYRIGYGSDTITDPTTGQVRKVTPNDRIDRSYADADLARRIPEFQKTAFQQTPAFGNLPPHVQAALTSVAYNYGSLPKNLVAAVNTGDLNQIASAVEALPANPDRRRQEAAIIRGSGTQAAQNAQSNTAQTAPIPNLNQNGTQTVANPFRAAQDSASPADEPASGAQNAQYVIPGGGAGQNTAASAPQVSAPRIRIPPHILAAAKDPNPFVRQWAGQQILEYQKIQRQLGVEAWKLNAQHGLAQPNKDREYNLNVDKFGHEKDKDQQDLTLRGRQVTATEGQLGVAQGNLKVNQDRLTHQVEQDNASNSFRNREVSTQEAAQRLRERQQDFDEGLKVNGPIDTKIVDDLDKGRAQAIGASDTLKDLDRQEANLNKGMFTGAGADAKQNIARYLTSIFPSLNDAVSAGQDYQAAVQREVGSLARQIAQTGHTTNMDINVGKMISAADPEYTEQAIREIIRQNRIRAQDVITRHNAAVDDYSSRNPAAANRAGFFKVNSPQAPDDAVTAEKNASTGTDLGPLPKGDQRAPIPRAYTAASVMAEGMKAYKQASQEPDPVKRAQMQRDILKRVHSYGIDPSRIAN